MTARTHQILAALFGALILAVTLPAVADGGHRQGGDRDYGDRGDYSEQRGPAWNHHRPWHRHSGPPPGVGWYGAPVVVYAPPVVYAPRVYYGPTRYYVHDPYLSIGVTIPLR